MISPPGWYCKGKTVGCLQWSILGPKPHTQSRTHTHTHTNIHTKYTHIQYTHKHTHNTHTRPHTHTHTIHTHDHTHIHTQTYTHTYNTHTHTHTHTHTLTHTYSHAQEEKVLLASGLSYIVGSGFRLGLNGLKVDSADGDGLGLQIAIEGVSKVLVKYYLFIPLLLYGWISVDWSWHRRYLGWSSCCIACWSLCAYQMKTQYS